MKMFCGPAYGFPLPTAKLEIPGELATAAFITAGTVPERSAGPPGPLVAPAGIIAVSIEDMDEVATSVGTGVGVSMPSDIHFPEKYAARIARSDTADNL